VTINLLLRFLILRREKAGAPARWDYTDPYKIAYLRAGISEALRVAVFSLIDRGLLKATLDEVEAEPQAGNLVKRPIEKMVVEFFGSPREVKEIFSDPVIQWVGEDYKQALKREGLFADSSTYAQRMPLTLTAICLIIGVSLTKIIIAIVRSRYNINFLIILSVVSAVWVLATWRRQRTGAGDEILHQMTLRFRSLKLRAASLRPGGITNEAAFLAAVFGLSRLSEDQFPYVRVLFPKAASSSSTYTGGCGSSGCGSSGCGGGGCGGGCGGCGS
jgi:uncharacterized protein (TIGR04222 family)